METWEMKDRVVARAPLRADLAGGTLDLWPLGAFHPDSRTVNVALDGWAECSIESSGRPGWRFESRDYGASIDFENLDAAEADDRTALVARLARHFKAPPGLRISTRSDSPPGSGLGGSSALGVAAAAAFAELRGEPLPGAEKLVALLRDLEAAHLGKPAGIQDFYPPILGGVLTIHHRPGGEVVDRHDALALELRDRLLFFHTGRSHLSAENNWVIFRKRCEGDVGISKLFDRIRDAARVVDEAVTTGDWNAFARGIDDEWSARQQLGEGIVTAEMAAVEARVRREGARAVKTCGAGGGGALLVVCEPETRERMLAIPRAELPGAGWLSLRATESGLVVNPERTVA